MTTQKLKVSAGLVFIAFAMMISMVPGCGGAKDDEIIPIQENVPRDANVPLASGSITLSVAGETITTDEIISSDELLENLRPILERDDMPAFHEEISKIITKRITKTLLFHLARKNAPANIDEVLDKEVEKEVNKFVASYGSNQAQAEKAMKELGQKAGFVDWDGFRESIKKEMMIQSYTSKKIKIDETVSHKEILDRYNEVKGLFPQNPEQIEFRLIEIQVQQLDANDVDVFKGENSHDATMRIAADLRKLIDKGEDFAAIAARFHGPYKNSKSSYTPGGLAAPYDVLEKQALNKKSGDIIGPIDAGDRAFIMKIESRTEAKAVTFETVQAQIESQIKFIRRVQQHDKMMAELVEAADIADVEFFIDACVEAAILRLKQE